MRCRGAVQDGRRVDAGRRKKPRYADAGCGAKGCRFRRSAAAASTDRPGAEGANGAATTGRRRPERNGNHRAGRPSAAQAITSEAARGERRAVVHQVLGRRRSGRGRVAFAYAACRGGIGRIFGPAADRSIGQRRTTPEIKDLVARGGLTAAPPSRSNTRPSRSGGQVAQLVEQRIENPRVGGSIPPLATSQVKSLRGGRHDSRTAIGAGTDRRTLPATQRAAPRDLRLRHQP